MGKRNGGKAEGDERESKDREDRMVSGFPDGVVYETGN